MRKDAKDSEEPPGPRARHVRHPDDRLLRLLRGEPFRDEQYSEGNLEQAARD